MENDQIIANRLKVGWAIRNERVKKGYSQEQFAELLNVTKPTISKIERGTWSITLDYLFKICGVLNMGLEITFKPKDQSENGN